MYLEKMLPGHLRLCRARAPGWRQVWRPRGPGMAVPPKRPQRADTSARGFTPGKSGVHAHGEGACRPAQPTWAPGSLLVWGEPPTLCEPAGLGSVLQVAQALLTRALRRAGPQLLLKACLAFAGTKTTGSRHGRNTSTTSPRTSGPSWLPGWPSSSSSRCEGLLDFWKGWGLRRQGCSEKGQEGRNWPGSGVWRLGDSPWSPRGVRCW